MWGVKGIGFQLYILERWQDQYVHLEATMNMYADDQRVTSRLHTSRLHRRAGRLSVNLPKAYQEIEATLPSRPRAGSFNVPIDGEEGS